MGSLLLSGCGVLKLLVRRKGGFLGDNGIADCRLLSSAAAAMGLLAGLPGLEGGGEPCEKDANRRNGDGGFSPDFPVGDDGELEAGDVTGLASLLLPGPTVRSEIKSSCLRKPLKVFMRGEAALSLIAGAGWTTPVAPAPNASPC
jgi:hypothetical protein